MKKIAIVEDDSELRTTLASKLTRYGYQVVELTEGHNAVLLLKSNTVDLVILDVMLPGGINGFDVLEEMKRDATLKNVPVIVLTNLDSEAHTAKSIGAIDYIVKSNPSMDSVVDSVRMH